MVDRIDEVLGALLALAGPPLGQAREPGHVGEHGRSIERLHQLGAQHARDARAASGVRNVQACPVPVVVRTVEPSLARDFTASRRWIP